MGLRGDRQGRGRLGFLERDYQIVEKVRDAINKSGVSGALGLSNTAVSVTKSIFNAIIAVVSILFLTLFMLLEGPAWMDRIYSLLLRSRSRAGGRSDTTSTARSVATSPATWRSASSRGSVPSS